MARLIPLEKRRKNSYETIFFFPCRRGSVGFGRTPSWHTWRAHQSYLSQQKVEALICTQDWLKDTHSPSLLDYDFEDLQSVDQGMLMFKLCNNIIIKYVITNDKIFFHFLKSWFLNKMMTTI